MKQRLLALAAGIAVLATAACGGHGSTTPPVSGSIPTFTQKDTFDWGKAQLQGANLLGSARAAHMQAMVVMNDAGALALVNYAQQVSDPHSPMYRRYLTPQEIGARFGASTSDYQKVADYFVSRGLRVA